MSGNIEGDGIASAGSGQGSSRGNPPGGGRNSGGGGGQSGGGGGGGQSGGGGGNRGRRRGRPGEQQDDRPRSGDRTRSRTSSDGPRGNRDSRNNKDRGGKPTGNKDRGGKERGGSGKSGPQGSNNQRNAKERQREVVVATRELSQPTEKALRESTTAAAESFQHKTRRYGMVLFETFAAAKSDLEHLQELTKQFDQLNIVIRAEGNMDDPELNALDKVKVFAGTAWALIHERRRTDGWYEEPR